jgi:hypothetical protein
MSAHEQSLTISANGTGILKYADLALCPSCSFGNAPVSTMTFVLTTVQTGTGVGSVEASSDPKGYAVGAPIDVKLVPGSAGQLLVFTINGQQSLPYCNATSAGQCGA